MLNALRYFTWQDVLLGILDVAIVAYLFYQVFVLIRGTRAVQLLKGVGMLLALVPVTQWLRLYTVNWVLVQIRTMLLVALPIVFYQELRRGLEQLGQGSLLTRSLLSPEGVTTGEIIDHIVEAVSNMSSSRTGALIVIAREAGLKEYTEEAVPLEARVTSALIENIFSKNAPLHDGAVVIKGERLVAASCFLPSTEESVAIELGTRHRAAIGITQVSDALAVVVSEETGTISLASGGRLLRGLDPGTLKEKLLELLPSPQPAAGLFHRGSRK